MQMCTLVPSVHGQAATCMLALHPTSVVTLEVGNPPQPVMVVTAIPAGKVSKARSAEFLLPPKLAELVRGGMQLGEADDQVGLSHRQITPLATNKSAFVDVAQNSTCVCPVLLCSRHCLIAVSSQCGMLSLVHPDCASVPCHVDCDVSSDADCVCYYWWCSCSSAPSQVRGQAPLGI